MTKPYVIPQLPDYKNGKGQERSGETMRSKIAKETALYQAQQKRGEFGQTKNLLLKQKMDILAWLSRSSSFLTESLAKELLETFRDTEVPYNSIEMRRKYLNQYTDSKAGLVVSTSLQDTMRPRAYYDLPEDLRRYYEEAGLSKEAITNRALVWPLRVLELLVSNDEQAESCLMRGNLVSLLSQVLILHGWGEPKTLRVASGLEASIVVNTLRILATLIIRPQA